MNVDQHIKVAEWHMEQARLHAANGDHSCGCPAVEKGNIEEETACSV